MGDRLLPSDRILHAPDAEGLFRLTEPGTVGPFRLGHDALDDCDVAALDGVGGEEVLHRLERLHVFRHDHHARGFPVETVNDPGASATVAPGDETGEDLLKGALRFAGGGCGEKVRRLDHHDEIVVLPEKLNLLGECEGGPAFADVDLIPFDELPRSPFFDFAIHPHPAGLEHLPERGLRGVGKHRGEDLEQQGRVFDLQGHGCHDAHFGNRIQRGCGRHCLGRDRDAQFP